MLPRELIEGTRCLTNLGMWPFVVMFALTMLALAPMFGGQPRSSGVELFPVELP